MFCLAATLFCLSLVPISLTHATPPALTESPRLTLKDLRRLAPVSLSGCATSGLTSSAFYSLIPAYAQMHGIGAGSVSLYISTAVFGGLAFQLPMGKLSDHFDRRIVAAYVAAGLSASALVLAFFPLPKTGMFVSTFAGRIFDNYLFYLRRSRQRQGRSR